MESALVSMRSEANVCQISYSSRHVNYLKSCCFGTVRRLVCDIICGIFTSSEHNLVFYGSPFTLKWYFAYQCVLSIVGEDLMYSGRKTMFPCRCFYLLSSCRLATGDQCLVRCVCYHVKNNFNNLNIVSKRFQTCCWWTAKKLWTICWWKDYCVSLFTWPFCWRTVVFIDVHTCTAVPAVCATHHQYGRVHRM